MNYDHIQVLELDNKVAAIVTQDSAKMFQERDVTAKPIEGVSKLGYIPWGDTNELPLDIVNKLGANEVTSSNSYFNTMAGYGMGVQYRVEEGEDNIKKNVDYFFKRNNRVKYWLEQQTDLKHFFFTVALISLTNDAKKIARLTHREALYCRLEKTNDDGVIKNVFFADWENNPGQEDIDAYPLLDEDDPLMDLKVRLGQEPDPATGKKASPTKDRVFAIIMKIPTPGRTYYPKPYYYSMFESGWYDLAASIPVAKNALMKNGLVLRYQVEIHYQYFDKLFQAEQITDPKKKTERRKSELENIKNFIHGVDNQGKVWYSTYYVDPQGKEQSMVRINRINTGKEGGDYIEDTEEASNILCYAMNVHPSLIGAVPGKNKGSFSGTDKRELFTMKQSMEIPSREILLTPYRVIAEYNGWDEKVTFEVPNLMLTTLDKGADAKEVVPVPVNEEEE